MQGSDGVVHFNGKWKINFEQFYNRSQKLFLQKFSVPFHFYVQKFCFCFCMCHVRTCHYINPYTNKQYSQFTYRDTYRSLRRFQCLVRINKNVLLTN